MDAMVGDPRIRSIETVRNVLSGQKTQVLGESTTNNERSRSRLRNKHVSRDKEQPSQKQPELVILDEEESPENAKQEKDNSAAQVPLNISSLFEESDPGDMERQMDKEVTNEPDGHVPETSGHSHPDDHRYAVVAMRKQLSELGAKPKKNVHKQVSEEGAQLAIEFPDIEPAVEGSGTADNWVVCCTSNSPAKIAAIRAVEPEQMLGNGELAHYDVEGRLTEWGNLALGAQEVSNIVQGHLVKASAHVDQRINEISSRAGSKFQDYNRAMRLFCEEKVQEGYVFLRRCEDRMEEREGELEEEFNLSKQLALEMMTNVETAIECNIKTCKAFEENINMVNVTNNQAVQELVQQNEQTCAQGTLRMVKVRDNIVKAHEHTVMINQLSEKRVKEITEGYAETSKRIAEKHLERSEEQIQSMNKLVESAHKLTTVMKEVYRDGSGENNNELAQGMQGCMKANGASTSKDHERDRKNG